LIIHLFGHLQGDFVVRVMFIDTAQTVETLADQLQAWGPELYPHPSTAVAVRNEGGTILKPKATLQEVGLDAGDIFTVECAPL
jgi:hypothetical protein